MQLNPPSIGIQKAVRVPAVTRPPVPSAFVRVPRDSDAFAQSTAIPAAGLLPS